MKQTFHARKRFGQNFLIDSSVIDQIVSVVAPKKGQRIVEIGPGLGALTKRILPMVETMDAIELDRDLIPKLKMACESLGNLHLHCADVLNFDFNVLTQDNGAPKNERPPCTGTASRALSEPQKHVGQGHGSPCPYTLCQPSQKNQASIARYQKKLRVIGNLPYNISSPLLFHLMPYAPLIQDMYFMLQKEVAERLAAKTGESAYGRLGIMIQYYCRVDLLFIVPPTAFSPEPKVESAFVRLIPHETLPFPAKDVTLLSDTVKQAFMQRRKTLRNALKNVISAEALQALGVDPTLRPEQISLEQFVRIADNYFDQRISPG